MNRLTLMTTAAALSANLLTAQAQFTLENTVYGGSETRNYYPYGLSAWPCQQTDDILYFSPSYDLVRSDAKGTATTLCSYQDLMEACGGRGSILRAENANDLWVYDADGISLLSLKDKSRRQVLKADYDEAAVAPRGGWVAYTAGPDLWLTNGQETRAVNQEHQDGVRYGSTVHRNEFGIGGGMFWSPTGTSLCFYRKDESMVSRYPLVDVNPAVGKVVETVYPMAGQTSEQVSVGVYDVATGKTVYLQTESLVDRYFTNISWNPAGTQICMAEINRDQNHAWINIYDAQTGQKIKTLFEEENDKWIEPCEPALWTDDTHFVWASYRDGFNHLYLYDTQTAKCRQLSSGEWCVKAVKGYNAKTKEVIAETNSDGYLGVNVMAVSLKGKMRRLTPQGAYAVSDYAHGQSRVAVSYSTPTMAKRWAIVGLDGKETVIQTTENPYKDFAMPAINAVPLKSADGRFDLTGRVILPPDFDASKKYPVIIYVYGGPHAQMVDGSWLYGAQPWMLYFAQEGYIVFSMDNRGSDKRGSAFEQAVHRQLGVCEMEDQMEGVKYLKSLPYVDADRIGVHGWSFGGFMTISLLTTHPDVFRAGVAGGPVCDWKYYEVMYGERYMDTPAQNPEGYEKTSLLNKIGNLKSRLLVVQGAMDSTVVWQNALMLTNSAIEKGVFFDQAVYPNHPHNVRGHDRVHLMGHVKRYFDDWLKKDE